MCHVKLDQYDKNINFPESCHNTGQDMCHIQINLYDHVLSKHQTLYKFNLEFFFIIFSFFKGMIDGINLEQYYYEHRSMCCMSDCAIHKPSTWIDELCHIKNGKCVTWNETIMTKYRPMLQNTSITL